MTKILRILNRFNLGGPVYNATYLSADLAPDYETTLIGGLPEHGEASALFIAENEGVTPRIVPELQRSIRLKNDRKAYVIVRDIIRELKPDIVHTHASKAGAIGRLAAINEKVPVVVHTFHGHVFHSYFGKVKTNFYKTFERSLAQRSSAIIAISERQREELTSVYKVAPPEKTHVIPLGFDLDRFCIDKAMRRERFRSFYALDTNDFAIGIVGRLAPVKNHFFFIDAFLEARKRSDRQMKAFIVGDGELYDRLEGYIRSRGLTSARCAYRSDSGGGQGETLKNADVIFTSWVTEVEHVLPGLDCVALTSQNEGTPVSLIEAQSAGIPVISTNVGGVRDIVLHEKTGWIVEPGNINTYSSCLNRLTNDHLLHRQFCEEGPKHTLARYSRSRLATDMRKLYESLL